MNQAIIHSQEDIKTIRFDKRTKPLYGKKNLLEDQNHRNRISKKIQRLVAV